MWGQYYWERTTEGKISDQDDENDKYYFDDHDDHIGYDHHGLRFCPNTCYYAEDEVLLDTVLMRAILLEENNRGQDL